MLKHAQRLQSQLQADLGATTVEGTAGGGMVTVVMNGKKEIRRLTIDPAVVSRDDVEMLQDLIIAAINDGHRKVGETMEDKVGSLLGDVKIPGLTG